MISIVILTQDECERLKAHLPVLLSQQGVEYEVIVVNMHSEDDTLDLLQNMEETHTRLRHLSLPAGSKDISLERLALHLGFRAALTPRILIMDTDTQLPTEHWLADVEKIWSKDCDTLIIPTLRTRTKFLGDYFTAGHEAWHNTLRLRQATRHGLMRAAGAVVGLNKEAFLSDNPPASLLALKTGIVDIYVAHTARRHSTLYVTDKELWPLKDANHNSHSWSQQRLFDAETSRHFPKRMLRRVTYMWHCLCTIHRGSLVYSLQDMLDNVRWCFTSKKTFTKKHY